MYIEHSEFRRFNETTDSLIKYNMNNAKKTFLFLQKEVYPYIYCYLAQGSKELTTIKFATDASDFMHMCGIKYKYKNSKDRFIYDLTNGQINYKKLFVHSDETTNQKFQVISGIPFIFNSLDIKISNKKQVKFSFNYDGYVATKKEILILGLKNIHSNFFVPQTLLNAHTEKAILNSSTVNMILRKHRNNSKIDVIKNDNTINITDITQLFN